MPTPIVSHLSIRPVAELHRWLLASRARYHALRLWLPYARAGVTLAIAEDCVAESNACAALAHSAETADREALRLLDSILAGGAITPSGIEALRRARAHVARSAEHDHDLAERATISTATP